MTSLRVSLLLLVLLTASYASARKLSGNTEEAMVDEPVVSVVSALPNGTQAMRILCNRDGSPAAVIDQALSVGEGCSWAATEKALYQCEAAWTRKFAEWQAFQHRRDAGQGQVHWLLKEEGFFLSVNGIGWVKKAVWKIE